MSRYSMRDRSRVLRSIRWAKPEDETETQLYEDALDAALEAFGGNRDALLGRLVLFMREAEDRR